MPDYGVYFDKLKKDGVDKLYYFSTIKEQLWNIPMIQKDNDKQEYIINLFSEILLNLK